MYRAFKYLQARYVKESHAKYAEQRLVVAAIQGMFKKACTESSEVSPARPQPF